MGRAIERVAVAEGHTIVARLGRSDRVTAKTLGDADVAIEFSTPESAAENAVRISAAGVDAVVGATGWTDRLDVVRTAVEEAGTGLIWAPNFSIGMQLFLRLSSELARLVDAFAQEEPYDVHVHESHHRHKADAPSGTARALADLLVTALRTKERWGPPPETGSPDPPLLTVSWTRAGEIAGTHVVGAEGTHDRLEVRHEAYGREGFARGAVAAAEWIRGRRGVYTLDDMLAERLAPQGDGRR